MWITLSAAIIALQAGITIMQRRDINISRTKTSSAPIGYSCRAAASNWCLAVIVVSLAIAMLVLAGHQTKTYSVSTAAMAALGGAILFLEVALWPTAIRLRRYATSDYPRSRIIDTMIRVACLMASTCWIAVFAMLLYIMSLRPA